MAMIFSNTIRQAVLITLLWIILSPYGINAQELYYTDLEKKMQSEYEQKNYALAQQAAAELLNVYPDNFKIIRIHV